MTFPEVPPFPVIPASPSHRALWIAWAREYAESAVRAYQAATDDVMVHTAPAVTIKLVRAPNGETLQMPERNEACKCAARRTLCDGINCVRPSGVKGTRQPPLPRDIDPNVPRSEGVASGASMAAAIRSDQGERE